MNRCTVKIMDSCIPLIVILGGTGTGKSKLGIEIAKKLCSEIISADSMQVYKGLDILTNKVTSEEMAEVPHHLLNFVSPLENFTVVDFRDKALPIIDRLFKTGKPPVIVGGTNYYIESILWKVLVKNIENAYFNNSQIDVLKLNEEAGVPSVSKGIKRKVDELNILPMDKSCKISNAINELSGLMNFCNELLKSLKYIFINEKKVTEMLERLIDEESIADIDIAVKLFEDSLKGHKQSIKFAVISLRCCLMLKNYISLILNNLKSECSLVLTDSAVSNPLIDELFANAKSRNPEFILVLTNALVENMKNVIKTYIPESSITLGDEAEIYYNLNVLNSLELHELLKSIDPERSAYLHPNDKRKILRSLQVWFSTGHKHSDILREQQIEGSALGGPLRFKNTIIFWLTADPDVLNKRLDDRVHQMIDHGLVKELLDFYSEYCPKEEDFTKGIFQSIGFKEFREFLFLTDEEKHGEIGEKKLKDGIETLKLVTRRYVKYQNKWIRNRFLKYPDREVPPIYNLDTTDVTHWDELVLNPALDLIMSTIEGRSSKLKPMSKKNEKTKDEIISMKSGAYYCQDCDRTFIGMLQWNTHINSNRHKKVVCKNKKNSAVVSCSVDKDLKEVEKIQHLKTNESLLNTGAAEAR